MITTTSNSYNVEMDKPARQPAYVRVIIEAVDPGAAGDTTVSNNGMLYYSVDSTLVYDRIPKRTYATFEKNRWMVNGEQLIPPREGSTSEYDEQGFIGTALAGEDGVYTTPSELNFTFTQQRTFPAVTIWFDQTTTDDDYPTSVTINGYQGSTLLTTVNGSPDSTIFVGIPDGGFNLIDRIQVLVNSHNYPGRRNRVQRVVFGYLINEAAKIPNATIALESDPLCRRLPNQTAGFEILDTAKDYNPENPTGIWNDMQERAPVHIIYGQFIDEKLSWEDAYAYDWQEIYETFSWETLYNGQFTEEIEGGWYYLSSKPGRSGNKATFTAVTLIDLLNDVEFKKSPIDGGDMLTLAELVLNESGVPKTTGGYDAWELWEGLSGITTTAPLPVDSCANVLLMIAQASCCGMWIDRRGVLQIQPLSFAPVDFYMHNRRTYYPIDVDPDYALLSVDVDIYSYTNIADSKELHNNEYTVTAGQVIPIDLSKPCKNVTVTAGGSATYEIFAQAVYVTFPTAGTFSVVINGQEIDSTSATYFNPVDGARPDSVPASCDNPLITSTERAVAVSAYWKTYLIERIVHSYGYRGWPQLDLLDTVELQSEFTERLPSCIVEHNLLFRQGSWQQSSIIGKRVPTDA